MATKIDFPFSDSIAGYVQQRQGRRVTLRTLDNRTVDVHLTDTTHGQRLRNLGRRYEDVSADLYGQLTPGRFVFCYGPIYPNADGAHYQASQLVFVNDEHHQWPFERPGWWSEQLRELATFYRQSQFAGGAIDFGDYRTVISGSGGKTAHPIQETDTISRMVYGMASAFMLTGDEDALAVANAGSAYLHDHLRYVDPDEDVVYWYHGLEKSAGREHQLFASEFGDDYRAIPAYEQIYALVGLTQTYRLTGAPDLLADIEGTVRLFEKFFHDPRLGGYYSHIDPVTLSPYQDSLGPNRARKNWNSVGDHAPAYLFNLYLATGDERYRTMLEHTFDMIVTHMPDRDSPFVQERFHADWSPDSEWGWQQDRAVVGHNLKIAWNLMRMQSTLPKREYRALAEKLGASMPEVGRDAQRGGWYDMLQRTAQDGRHAFVWHDRKTWWQQEQAILAYLILAGTLHNDEFLQHARESSAFYNSFFLDHDEGGVFFTVLAQGLPYLVGNERLKGSHAMAMYHKAELCFLAETYTQLLINKEPLNLHFNPQAGSSFPGGLLRVAPDILPPGRICLDRVLIDGAPYSDFDASAMTVKLPDTDQPLRVQATLRPHKE
ncbi:AGE family epimerase/isomerase [Streptomyces sp. NBC_00009]|uniref:AGE family epimerase/isomerase n=1 Tax=Streptomyces sp. NBC_00009 TaxID=2975620 RepID=UPI00324B02DE